MCENITYYMEIKIETFCFKIFLDLFEAEFHGFDSIFSLILKFKKKVLNVSKKLSPEHTRPVQ